jgi:Tfp pilus assembly protein PilN|tara:strand:- start:147 stop:614 length:468 start_codon:yes stop_codon:yes gene_type:complete
MIKEKTKEISIILAIVLVLVLVGSLSADEMVHKFKNPAFSGQGTSSHYLTIENQETNRRQAIKDEIQALKDKIERDQNNTVEARFMRNLTSRIYAQLARQIEENLFGEVKSNYGSMILEGNTIEYEITDETVTVTITDEDGNVTQISVPVGSFTF